MKGDGCTCHGSPEGWKTLLVYPGVLRVRSLDTWLSFVGGRRHQVKSCPSRGGAAVCPPCRGRIFPYDHIPGSREFGTYLKGVQTLMKKVNYGLCPSFAECGRTRSGNVDGVVELKGHVFAGPWRPSRCGACTRWFKRPVLLNKHYVERHP